MDKKNTCVGECLMREIRLIDANELIRNLACDICGVPFHGNRKTTYADIRAEIEACKTIDPESLRGEGEWKERLPGITWECSKCEYIVKSKTPFCPNCGAKMDKE